MSMFFIVIDLCFHLRACENTKMKGTKEFVSSPTIREAAYFPSGLSFFWFHPLQKRFDVSGKRIRAFGVNAETFF